MRNRYKKHILNHYTMWFINNLVIIKVNNFLQSYNNFLRLKFQHCRVYLYKHTILWAEFIELYFQYQSSILRLKLFHNRRFDISLWLSEKQFEVLFFMAILYNDTIPTIREMIFKLNFFYWYLFFKRRWWDHDTLSYRKIIYIITKINLFIYLAFELWNAMKGILKIRIALKNNG